MNKNRGIRASGGAMLLALGFVVLSFIFAPAVSFSAESTDTKANVLSQLGEAVQTINQDLQAGKNQLEIKLSEDAKELLSIFNPNRVNTAKVLSDYFSDCWFCDFFSVIFDAINELSYAVWEYTRLSFVMLLGLLGAFWLILRIMGHIASMVPQSPGEFWTKISRVLLKMMLVGAIFSVSIGAFIGQWIIAPISLGAAELTAVIVQSYGNAGSAFVEAASTYNTASTYTGSNDIKGFNQSHELGDSINPIEPAEPLDYERTRELQAAIKNQNKTVGETQSADSQQALDAMQDELMRSVLGSNTGTDKYFSDCSADMTELAGQAMAEAEAMGNKAAVDGALNVESKVAFLCMLESMNQELSFGMALGSALVSYGWTAYRWWFLSLPDFAVILAGALIWLVCFILMFIFFAKLVDVCIRLGVLCTIMPLLLICFVFPSTEEYVKNAFKQFTHTICVFIVMAIVLALAVLLVMQAFQLGKPDLGEQYDIRTLFYLGQMDEIRHQLNLSGRSFLGAAACFLFAIMSIKMVDGVAAQFTQVTAHIGGAGVGTAAGDGAFSTIAKAGANVGQGGGNLAKSGVAKAKGSSIAKVGKGGDGGGSKSSSGGGKKAPSGGGGGKAPSGGKK